MLLITPSFISYKGLIVSVLLNQIKSYLPPSVNTKLVNKSICQVSKNKMMMTCFLGVVDKNTKIVHYVNASHEAPFILSARQDLKKKDLVFLDESKCNRLGQSSTSEFSVAQYQLSPGDRIFVYTDGVPDIRNKKEESLQERGLFKVVIVKFFYNSFKQ